MELVPFENYAYKDAVLSTQTHKKRLEVRFLSMFVQETLVKMASTKLANARYLQCNLQLDRRVETALLAYIQAIFFHSSRYIFFYCCVGLFGAHRAQHVNEITRSDIVEVFFAIPNLYSIF